MCEQAQPNSSAPSRNRHHDRGEAAGGTNIVAASLVWKYGDMENQRTYHQTDNADFQNLSLLEQ
jgi:hypothetical protein